MCGQFWPPKPIGKDLLMLAVSWRIHACFWFSLSVFYFCLSPTVKLFILFVVSFHLVLLSMSDANILLLLFPYSCCPRCWWVSNHTCYLFSLWVCVCACVFTILSVISFECFFFKMTWFLFFCIFFWWFRNGWFRNVGVSGMVLPSVFAASLSLCLAICIAIQFFDDAAKRSYPLPFLILQAVFSVLGPIILCPLFAFGEKRKRQDVLIMTTVLLLLAGLWNCFWLTETIQNEIFRVLNTGEKASLSHSESV